MAYLAWALASLQIESCYHCVSLQLRRRWDEQSHHVLSHQSTCTCRKACLTRINSWQIVAYASRLTAAPVNFSFYIIRMDVVEYIDSRRVLQIFWEWVRFRSLIMLWMTHGGTRVLYNVGQIRDLALSPGFTIECQKNYGVCYYGSVNARNAVHCR